MKLSRRHRFKKKLNFTEDEKKLLKRKQGFKVKNLTGFCTENVVYQPLNVKEWQVVSCPGETLTDVSLRQHICLKVQHRDNEIIQLNKTPNVTYSCTSKCLSQNITGEFL